MQEIKKKNTGISERILHIIENEDINPNVFAKKLGYERSQTIYDLINGKSAPSFDFFSRFENSEFSAKYNISWLITGNNPVLKAENEYRINIEEFKVREPAIKYTKSPNGIPLIPINAMAGMFNGEIKVLECECERYIIPVFKDAEFLIPMRGSSMMPKYNNGDILACKPLPLDTFFQWNKVYVIDTDQGALAKRIKKGSAPDTLLIVSDNPEYDPFELPRSAIYHIALVVGVIRLE
jgi:phage repressor protein C with HTH and peptisase S24 domain